MPFSDIYVPVDEWVSDQGSNKPAEILVGVAVVSGEVIVTVRCRETGILTKLLYDRRSHLFHKELPQTHGLIDLSWYSCSGECGFMSHVTKLDAGQRFLHIRYHCSICRHTFSRYYSISERGYVLIPRPLRGSRSQLLAGWGKFRGQEPFTEDGSTFYTTPSDYVARGNVR